jgi:hypothetical protein
MQSISGIEHLFPDGSPQENPTTPSFGEKREAKMVEEVDPAEESNLSGKPVDVPVDPTEEVPEGNPLSPDDIAPDSNDPGDDLDPDLKEDVTPSSEEDQVPKDHVDDVKVDDGE